MPVPRLSYEAPVFMATQRDTAIGMTDSAVRVVASCSCPSTTQPPSVTVFMSVSVEPIFARKSLRVPDPFWGMIGVTVTPLIWKPGEHS